MYLLPVADRGGACPATMKKITGLGRLFKAERLEGAVCSGHPLLQFHIAGLFFLRGLGYQPNGIMTLDELLTRLGA